MNSSSSYVFITLIFCQFLFCNLSKGQSPKDGIDTVSTINSFGPVGEFYKMDYSGDYSDFLDQMDDWMTGKDSRKLDEFKCSLFSARGDLNNQLFGRNFDNDNNDVLLARYNPPDGYSSLAFTRMSDLGFSHGTNYDILTFHQKLPLLHSAYFVPDGINEYGLAAGLASVETFTYTVDPSKDTIFVTRLIREILDHAQNIDDALMIANSYNVFDMAVNALSHHVLVGSFLGESVALEYAEGEFKAVNTDSAWQVITNIPVYNIPIEQLMNSCWRYNILYSELQDRNGIVSWDEGMSLLEQVHMNCPWSAIYDLNNEGIYIAIDNNYDDIAYTDLENFDFTIYVGIASPKIKMTETCLDQNYPNPFREKTKIGFSLTENSKIELSVYDRLSRKIKVLLNETMKAGQYSIIWDGKSETGEMLPPGVYWCNLKTRNSNETIQMIIVGD